MEILIIDEAEDFIVVGCCVYTQYIEYFSPPWELDPDGLWIGIE